MVRQSDPPAIIDFGPFSILPDRRELLADGRPIRLGGRAFDLLMALIEASGAVVGKGELLSHVWQGRVVEENRLPGEISALRKAFGAHRELIRHKETGYLFPPDSPRHLAEGVLTALADRDSWPRLRARAIEFIDSERSWVHSVERYSAVYQRVLKN